jgi:hypothetical protein
MTVIETDALPPYRWAAPLRESAASRRRRDGLGRSRVVFLAMSRGRQEGCHRRRAHDARRKLGGNRRCLGGVMKPVVLLDTAGRRRSTASMPDHHRGRAPRNKGVRYPADPTESNLVEARGA